MFRSCNDNKSNFDFIGSSNFLYSSYLPLFDVAIRSCCLVVFTCFVFCGALVCNQKV